VIHHLDIRDFIAPITFLKVIQAFRAMKPGEILEIQGNDSDTRKEIFQVLDTFPYQVINIEEKKRFYKIRLKKEINKP